MNYPSNELFILPLASTVDVKKSPDGQNVDNFQQNFTIIRGVLNF